jgi:thiol-disulfide isomerase/thioredoxin
MLSGSAVARAQANPGGKGVESTLKIGDKAPMLKADKWLQGSPVTAFEPGKVYVVEFWATWCGPCIVMMPHMADMAEEYKSKGVTIIGYTAKDPNNGAERVAKFVEKRGPKLGYTFAYSGDRDTYNAWMTASGQRGIPCSFVVDKSGKIAYIGHPMFLDGVLPRVLDGSWDAAKGKEDTEAAVKDFQSAFQAFRAPDPEDGLKALTDLTKKRPALADVPYLLSPRLQLLLKAKKYDELKALAEKTLTRAARRDDTIAVSQVAAVLRSPDAIANKELLALAVKAAQTSHKLAGEDDLPSLLGLVEAYKAAGDTANVSRYGKQAVTVAEKAVKGDKDFRGLLVLAAAQQAAGDKGAAKAAAERAIAATDGQPAQIRQIVTLQARRFGAEPKSEEKKDQ